MSDYTLGDKPIEPHYRDMMNALARGVDKILNGEERPKLNGFVLLVFPLEGHEGRANYISNASRGDVIILLKQQLARFEGQADVRGNA
jgi:hypothetical protein